MKRTLTRTGLLVTVLTLTWVSTASAQPNMDPEERLNRTMTELTEKVGLSEAQQKQIRPLMQAEIEKQMELFTAARESGDFQGIREQMTAIRSETDEKVLELLDDAQDEKYEAWREEVAARRRQRMGG